MDFLLFIPSYCEAQITLRYSMSGLPCSNFYLSAIEHSTQAWLLHVDSQMGGPRDDVFFSSGSNSKELLHVFRSPEHCPHVLLFQASFWKEMRLREWRAGKGESRQSSIFPLLTQHSRLPEMTPARLPTRQSLARAERTFWFHIKSLSWLWLKLRSSGQL